MSSDADYAAFLDQVNQDTGAGNVSTTQQSGFATTKTVDTDVPATLQTIDRYYTSDTDEAFEPVSLSWKNSALPDEGERETPRFYAGAPVARRILDPFPLSSLSPALPSPGGGT